jgi:adenylate cyclase class 2
MPNEVEVKFVVSSIDDLERTLLSLGFLQQTPFTFERNTLYDSHGALRSRGEILRLRQYGERWVLTHKSKGTEARHKIRVERETAVANGTETDAILRALGYEPAFVYEKHRAEWTDGAGEVVIDRTPIGNLAELEGQPAWIDTIASKLGVRESDYITKSYGQLFEEWRQQTGSPARNMTFEEIGEPRRRTLPAPYGSRSRRASRSVRCEVLRAEGTATSILASAPSPSRTAPQKHLAVSWLWP